MRGRASPTGLPLLLAVLVAACGPGLASPSDVPRTAALPLSPAIRTVGADQVMPLPNGPTAFAMIRSLLTQATRSIHLEMYEFQREDLAALIVQASARGVAVTAIMDPSERGSRALWSELEQSGIRVIAFPVEARSIDHVKLLIVDTERAVLGGINWGRHSEENHDYDVLVLGPVVQNLERVFEADLALAGRPAVMRAPQPDPMVQVLVTRPGEGIRSAVLDAIAAARRTIDVEMFVLSDPLVLDSLAAAARRQLAVRVLLEASQPQNAQAAVELSRAGARVRFFRGRSGAKLHAKAGVFDAAIVLFGSCNWTRSGFSRNHELDLLIPDVGVAAVFLQQLESDWRASAA